MLGMAGGNVKHNATCTDGIAATTCTLVVESTRSIHAHCNELGMIPEGHVGKQTMIGTPALAQTSVDKLDHAMFRQISVSDATSLFGLQYQKCCLDELLQL